MTSPAMDISSLLVTLSLGTEATDLFINHIPEAPDNLIAIFDTGGMSPSDRLAVDNPTIQIKTRNNSQSSAYDKIEAILLALQSKSNTTINSKDYFGFYVQTPPYFLNRDENERSIFVMNMRLILTPYQKGYRL